MYTNDYVKRTQTKIAVLRMLRLQSQMQKS